MARIRPFRGVRPRPDLAHEVIAPPYDVLSEEEARRIVARRPRSFLRVTRPEVNLPPGADPHGAEAYAAARAAYDGMKAERVLVRDPEPRLYLYAQTWRGRTQVALMAACATEDYDRGLIRRHELTRPDKEQDRVDHILAVGAQTGLVFLAYRDRHEALRDALARAAEASPEAWAADTPDGVHHAFRVVEEPALVEAIVRGFEEVPVLYVADGHHRSAAASRVARQLGGRGESGWFLCGIFPDSQLQVLAYNRVVAGLDGQTPAGLLRRVAERFEVSEAPSPIPPGRGRFTMYLDGRWHLLAPRPGVVPEGDAVASLDVSVLQDNVLGPLLGIGDPRRDPRIRFVGGIRGPEELVRQVEAERAAGREAVAFHLHPTGLDQLFAVADAGALMPPKSTWFEPKLLGGVVVHELEA